ncbi:MAG: hypothetical protein ACP5IL_11555 [Syntrophobacteraceae bacterium]
MFDYSRYQPWWWLFPISMCVLFLASLPFLPYTRRHGWRISPSHVLAILTLLSFLLVIIASFR